MPNPIANARIKYHMLKNCEIAWSAEFANDNIAKYTANKMIPDIIP